MLNKGHLPGSKGRKSLLAQELEKRQKRFSMEYEKLAEDEGSPVDLVRKPSVSTAQCSVSEYETGSTGRRLRTGKAWRAELLQHKSNRQGM